MLAQIIERVAKEKSDRPAAKKSSEPRQARKGGAARANKKK
jgi:hypothetical protein